MTSKVCSGWPSRFSWASRSSAIRPLDPSLNALVKASARPHNLVRVRGFVLGRRYCTKALVCRPGFWCSAACARPRSASPSSPPARAHAVDPRRVVALVRHVSDQFAFWRHCGFSPTGKCASGGWIGYLLTTGLTKAVNDRWFRRSCCGRAWRPCFVFYTGRTWSEIVQSPRDILEEWMTAAFWTFDCENS